MAILGISSALLGGANMVKGSTRVLIGGWIAMACTYGIGRAFGASTI